MRRPLTMYVTEIRSFAVEETNDLDLTVPFDLTYRLLSTLVSSTALIPQTSL
jgi:hypothetical protein